jgi:CRP-like cAMP-binding protein
VNPNVIESMPLLASLSRRRRRVFAALADEVEVPSGYRLTTQAGYAQEFFVVVSGTAAVYRDGEHVDSLGPGEFFGEVGLLGPRWERTATVVATSPMRLAVLARRQFQELLFRLPGVAATIREAAAVRG